VCAIDAMRPHREAEFLYYPDNPGYETLPVVTA
jgi:hypothetical protein